MADEDTPSLGAEGALVNEYLAPPEPDLEIDDLDDETEEEHWAGKPRSGRSGVVAFFPRPASPSTVEVQPTRAMAKRKRDPIREDRIHDEAIVDAYDRECGDLSWRRLGVGAGTVAARLRRDESWFLKIDRQCFAACFLGCYGAGTYLCRTDRSSS